MKLSYIIVALLVVGYLMLVTWLISSYAKQKQVALGTLMSQEEKKCVMKS